MTWFLYGTAEQYPNYCRAFGAAGGAVLASPTLSDACRCDALLLAGGGDVHPRRYGQLIDGAADIDETRDERELMLIDTFAAARKPILGICRGLQLLNVYFGGTLHQHIVGHSQRSGRDSVHPTHTDDALLHKLYGERFTVNSAHHQSVDALGRKLRAVQWAQDGTIEALRHDTLPIFTVQWHPERTALCAAQGCVDGSALLRALNDSF